MADGTVCKASVVLTLQAGDRDIIEAFRSYLPGCAPAREITRDKLPRYSVKEQVRFILSSVKMVEDLASHGCVPNKSLTLGFPSHIHGRLVRHFVRGYFDGDGCIVERDGILNRAEIVSSARFCNCLGAYYKKHFGYTPIMKATRRDNWVCAYRLTWSSSKEGRKFLAWLYSNTNLYMERKYQQWCRVLDHYAKSRRAKIAYSRSRSSRLTGSSCQLTLPFLTPPSV